MSMRPFARVAALAPIVVLVTCGRAATPGAAGAPVPARAGARGPGPPRNGLEVIGWMRYAHPSRALRTLSFTVETTHLGADSARKSRARVHLSLPGKLRVEQLPASARTGTVRNRQFIAVFERGRRVALASRVDLTTLLAYDVFAQSVDTTIMWLDSARVRFGPARRDRFDGREVWVVGAADGDLTSTQFWVDAERWRLVRVIQPEPRSPSRISEMRFTRYMELLDVPVPTEIVIYRDGTLVQRQAIVEISANPAVSSRAFDLARWRRSVSR